MNPVLYPKNATSVSNLGVGVLGEAVNCYVQEKINDYFTLQMQYPVNGAYAADIEIDSIIAASVKGYALRQLFRVVKIEKDEYMMTIEANHISYQLNGIAVKPFTANTASAAMSGIKTNSASTNSFNFSSSITSSTHFEPAEPKSAREMLLGDGGITATYGGEILFNNYNVTLVQRRGGESDSDLMYAKNIVTIKREISADDLVTAIFPFYSKDGTFISLTEGILTASTASNYAFYRTAIVDLTSEFTDNETPSESLLRTKAQAYLSGSGIGLHTDAIEVEPILLDRFSGMERIPENTYIGDNITVDYEPLGISYYARITAYEWDVIMERYNAVTVGQEGQTLADYIATGGSYSSAGGGGGGGATLVIDTAMSDTSANAVMNRVIKNYVDGIAATKVDKVTGKGLSTNDFTNTLKDKLDGIAAGAEVNVQANWNETNTSSDAYIQNKPTIPTVNDATLYIRRNGVPLATFSANQGGADVYAEIQVPNGRTWYATTTGAEPGGWSATTETSDYVLTDGSFIYLLINRNFYSASLNVDNTGMKSISKTSGSLTSPTSADFEQNKIYLFVYDGTYYVLVGQAVSASGGVSDVRNAAGTSLVSSGIATIPSASNVNYGVLKVQNDIQPGGGYATFTQYINGSDYSFYVPNLSSVNDTIRAKFLPAATTSTKGAVIVDNAMSDNSTNAVQNSVIKTYVDGKALPTVTSSDNGKVLMVQNGVWAAASLPSANGNSF